MAVWLKHARVRYSLHMVAEPPPRIPHTVAMAMTPKVLARIDVLGRTIAAAIECGDALGGARGGGREGLEERHYRRVGKFDGSGS